MDYVEEYGINVPNIKSIQTCGDYAVMLMDWANGKPLRTTRKGRKVRRRIW